MVCCGFNIKKFYQVGKPVAFAFKGTPGKVNGAKFGISDTPQTETVERSGQETVVKICIVCHKNSIPHKLTQLCQCCPPCRCTDKVCRFYPRDLGNILRKESTFHKSFHTVNNLSFLYHHSSYLNNL